MDLDTAALDSVPELYRQAIAAVERVGSLIAAGGEPAEVAFAAERLDDLRDALERGAGQALAALAAAVLLTREESLREGRALGRCLEAGDGQPPPRLRLASSQ